MLLFATRSGALSESKSLMCRINEFSDRASFDRLLLINAIAFWPLYTPLLCVAVQSTRNLLKSLGEMPCRSSFLSRYWRTVLKKKKRREKTTPKLWRSYRGALCSEPVVGQLLFLYGGARKRKSGHWRSNSSSTSLEPIRIENPHNQAISCRSELYFLTTYTQEPFCLHMTIAQK